MIGMPIIQCIHLSSGDHGMQGRVKWAIAGRNQAKLESIRSHVAEMNPECKVCCCSVHIGQCCLHHEPAYVGLPHVQQRSLTPASCSTQNVPIILGDITDQASLDSMASQSKVVIATAGPFARYGTPVVDACVRSGADYCDITGK